MEKWCYGMTEKGKWHGEFDEKWEAIEKGNEMARSEGLTHFYVGNVGQEFAENVERVEVEGI